MDSYYGQGYRRCQYQNKEKETVQAGTKFAVVGIEKTMWKGRKLPKRYFPKRKGKKDSQFLGREGETLKMLRLGGIDLIVESSRRCL